MNGYLTKLSAGSLYASQGFKSALARVTAFIQAIDIKNYDGKLPELITFNEFEDYLVNGITNLQTSKISKILGNFETQYENLIKEHNATMEQKQKEEKVKEDKADSTVKTALSSAVRKRREQKESFNILFKEYESKIGELENVVKQLEALPPPPTGSKDGARSARKRYNSNKRSLNVSRIELERIIPQLEKALRNHPGVKTPAKGRGRPKGSKNKPKNT
jgi:hypothetical protein